MPHDYFYRELKQYGEKLYPFAQRKSLNFISDAYFGDDYQHIKDGVCMAATVDWLQEKLWSVDRNERNFEHTELTRTDKAAARERNANTMWEAAWDHIAYTNAVMDEMSRARGREHLLKLRGLQSDEVGGPGSRQDVQTNVVESIVSAADQARLPSGGGVLITFGVGEERSHSVALYRGNDDHLYFFDPNCGVYKVNDLRNFCAAWKRACETRWNEPLLNDPDDPAHSVNYITKRPGLDERPPRLSNNRVKEPRQQTPDLDDMVFAPPTGSSRSRSPGRR